MDRQHRRELKHDKFVDEVGALTERARQNQRLLVLVGAAVILIAAASYGYYFYQSTQERKGQQALATAIETMDAPLVIPGQTDPKAKFKTEEERNAAAEKQFKAVQADFSGTDAADVAGLYLARISASRGDTATARKLLQAFVADHPKHLLVGSARYSLYQMRIDGGEAAQVVIEINAEIMKEEPVLPADSLLLLLAHAYEVQGNEQKTRETYRRLVTEYPDSPFALEAQRRVGPA
jgi:TolA-binding protein